MQSTAGTQTSATKTHSSTQIRSRYIRASERRKVLLKNQKGCTFKDPKTGRICQSKHGLQFEHIKPFSQGGDHRADNLTLLCGAHNRYQAERMGLYHPR
jgi:predicted restriction endonuclease